MYMHGLKDCNCNTAPTEPHLDWGVPPPATNRPVQPAPATPRRWVPGGKGRPMIGLFGLSDSSSSSSKSTATATTQTAVTTQVSPQISPNFIQQQQPTNSAVNASTYAAPSLSASIPFVPQTGMIPGIDSPPMDGAYMPQLPQLPGNPNVLSVTPGIDMTTLLYGALGVMGVAIIVKMMKKRKSANALKVL